MSISHSKLISNLFMIFCRILSSQSPSPLCQGYDKKSYLSYRDILISIALASSAINLLTSSVSNIDIGC